MELFKRSFPKIKFIRHYRDEDIQCHMPMGNMCKFFVNNLKDVKCRSKQYLIPEKKRSNLYRNKIKNKKNICGLSWISNSNITGQYKSVSLELLKNILLLPNYIFVDLQYGNTSKERNDFFKKYGVKIIKEDIDNFEDIDSLTSLIDSCDEIITISNTTAHISGAIGKKTHLLLPKGKGNLWYWSKERNKSIWYNSVKIYQQTSLFEWKDPILDLYNTLRT
tara:strand:- start:110 stop:772 length:663 start_codon:yes stop_codon:yes gene_type:complete